MTDETHEEILREIVKDTIDRLSPAAQSAIRRVREHVLTDEEGRAYEELPRHIRESWGFTALGQAVRVELEKQNA